VDHPLATKFSMEVLGHAEDAAVDADVLADDDDVLVPLHLLEQRQVQRLDHVQFCHRLVFRWPRMGGDGGGSGAAVLSSGLRSREATSSRDRKSTRLNSSHVAISYAVFCLKKKRNGVGM